MFFTKILGTMSYTIAQSAVPVDDVLLTPNFFMAIIAGVVLALAFQFVLTIVSVAAGVTAMGNLKKAFVNSNVDPSGNAVREEYGEDRNDSPYISTGVKLTSAFGIWSVVTTCVALFGATALATNLSVVETSMTNTVIALVVWALFFLILFYLETRIAGTLIGNLVSAATLGLKNSASAIGGLFTPSKEQKIEGLIGSTIDRVRKEMEDGLDTGKLSETLDNFLSRVDEKVPNYEDLRNDLEGIAEKSGSGGGAGKWMAVQQTLTKLIDENSKSADPVRKGKAEKLKETLKTVRERFDEAPTKKEGAKNVIEEFTQLERREIDGYVQHIQEYLSSTGSDGLSPEKVKAKLGEILDNPSLVVKMVSNGYKDMDRDKIVGLLDRNTNLNREDINRYADIVEENIRTIVKEFDKDNEDRLVKRMEGRVRGFFESTGKKELDFDLLKRDVMRIMDNPNEGIQVIKDRVSTFDSATFKALATNNRYIYEEDIDSVIGTFENAKKDVLKKISQIETKANQQMEMLKRKAVIQAEHARETAMSAAWWLVLSAVLSAVAAMGGSALAL